MDRGSERVLINWPNKAEEGCFVGKTSKIPSIFSLKSRWIPEGFLFGLKYRSLNTTLMIWGIQEFISGETSEIL